MLPALLFFSSQERFTESDLEQLRKVVDQDPLAQLDEQDKELIWKMRYGEVQRRGWLRVDWRVTKCT